MIKIPGAKVLWISDRGAVPFRLGQCRLDRRDDGLGYFVLHGEDVFQIAVVMVGPKQVAGTAVNQLGGDADTITGLSYATF